MPAGAQLPGQPRRAAHHVVALGARADAGQQRRPGFPDCVNRLFDAVRPHVILDAVGRAAQRQFAQGDQVPFAEKIARGAFGLLFLVDLAAFQARQQFVGGDIDQYHFIGQVKYRVRHGFGNPDAGDAADHIVEAFQVLDVHRREDVDAGVQQFFDVLPALRMARTGGIRMGQFIHQNQRRRPLQRAIEVEFADRLAAVLDRLERQHVQPFQHGGGLAAAMRFDHAHQHRAAFAHQLAGGGQHAEGLANAGRGAKIDAQLAACGAPVLRLHVREQGIRIRSLWFV